jgi:DNA-directed RNA polymerase subunit M/transcription elongation factor TFIIS
MPRYCPRCGESLHGEGTTKGETRKTARRAYEPAKKKRGPSAYNKKYAAAYKRLKKKHPRSSFAALAKKAHKAVKK